MRVRQPTFDFTGVDPHWTGNAEFAHSFSAAGIVPAYIEPYLIKVMPRVLPGIGEDEVELRRDVETFIMQEAPHDRHHRAFNEVIRDARCARMADFERAYEASCERFWPASPCVSTSPTRRGSRRSARSGRDRGSTTASGPCPTSILARY